MEMPKLSPQASEYADFIGAIVCPAIEFTPLSVMKEQGLLDEPVSPETAEGKTTNL